MALNVDSFLRVRFLGGRRLPPLAPCPATGPLPGVGLRNSTYSKPSRRRIALRPTIRAANVTDTVTVEPVVEAPQQQELYMGTFANYLDLDAEETSLPEIVKFLADGKIGELKSARCPSGTVVDSPARRALIALSLVLQKIILEAAAPGVGNMVVMMNLIVQANFSNLVWDFITGQITLPDVNSQNFRSPFAFIDTRVELDPSITPCDSTYKTHLCVMASKLSYENAERIRNTVRGYWNEVRATPDARASHQTSRV